METLLLIFLILSIVAGIVSAIKWCESVFGGILTALFMSFLYFLGSCFIIVVIFESILDSVADKKETPYKTVIYGINKETTVGGTFLIGCGNINNEYRYSYYVRYGSNQSFKLDDVKASKSVIIEDEEVQPYILKWKKVEIVNKKAWKSWIFEMSKNEELDNIEIHVPKGTIVQDMKGRL